ncbi:uncharacterized protein LOC143292980 isoform X2 [Babylonia areolata]
MTAHQLAWLVGRWVGRGILGLAVITFFLQWVLPRLKKWYSQHASQSLSTVRTDGSSVSDVQMAKQDSIHQELQEKHQAKVASFKERILQPRAEAKKQQKEEEFYRFLGPAWKGRGQILGSVEEQQPEQEELDQFEKDLNPREIAALRRRIQTPAPQPAKPPPKPKRVITLPEEPSEDDPERVLVMLRSPIQTVCQRCFRHTDTVQTLLDFMTVSGFTQTFNTLCTSFPRHDLAQDTNLTLQDLGFIGGVTLNIEEKDV